MSNEVKHTPGPWEYRENCIYPTSRQRCIARLDWHIRDEVDDANARLIAAAPELLEALQSAADFIEREGFTMWDGGSLSRVRAVIAKATL